jgi:hypothetical protein
LGTLCSTLFLIDKRVGSRYSDDIVIGNVAGNDTILSFPTCIKERL